MTIEFKNQRVGVKFGVTINTGDYSSVRFELESAADITDEDAMIDARLALMTELQNEARGYMSRIKSVNAPKIPDSP